MEYESRTVTLKDGRTCLLRSPTGADAEQMLEYMHIMLDETPYLCQSAAEFAVSAEQEAEFLEKTLAQERALMLSAFDGERIVANCDFRACGAAGRTRHRAALGISILREYWNNGLGSLLMDALITAARAAGYEQLELDVVAANRRAISLYLKHGFSVYGTRPHGLHYDDGTYADEYLMAKQL